MSKVCVYKRKENNKLGLGVSVADETATVQDLLAVWEPLAGDPRLPKKYAQDTNLCRGCLNNCCHSAFVIPDLVAFKALSKRCGMTPEKMLAAYFDPDSLRMGIPRLGPGLCPFLKDRICTVYPERSLLCRFYLCTHILGETEELLYSVVTAGVAATLIWLEELKLLPKGRGLTGFDQVLTNLLASYRQHPGTAAFLAATDYSQVKLKLFIK